MHGVRLAPFSSGLAISYLLLFPYRWTLGPHTVALFFPAGAVGQPSMQPLCWVARDSDRHPSLRPYLPSSLCVPLVAARCCSSSLSLLVVAVTVAVVVIAVGLTCTPTIWARSAVHLVFFLVVHPSRLVGTRPHVHLASRRLTWVRRVVTSAVHPTGLDQSHRRIHRPY